MFSLVVKLFLILTTSYIGNDNCDYAMLSEFWTYDELPVFDDGWFGLFETDSGQVLRKVSIELAESSYQPDPDERPEPFYIEFENPIGTPIFIFTSSACHFREGLLEDATFRDGRFELGDSFLIRGQGYPDLWLKSTKDGLTVADQDVIQVLTKTYSDYSKGTYISIVWAGDLDRDGQLDFILDDIDDSYNRFYHKLFLSSEAGEGDLVGEVASSYDVFY